MTGKEIEPRNVDLLRQYLNEIGEYPLLSKEEEYELWEQMQPGKEAKERFEIALQQGDEIDPDERLLLEAAIAEYNEAKEQFITSNLRLVVSIAKRYQLILPLMEAIQEGNLGLEHAVDKFDARKGFKFSTYATWWIRQAITRGAAESPYNQSARFPAHVNDDLATLRKTHGHPEFTHEQLSDPAFIEEITGISIARQEYLYGLQSIFRPQSLDQPTNSENDTELGSLIADVTAEAPDEAAGESDMRARIIDLLQNGEILDQREAEIINLRYGFGGERESLEQVGRRYYLTRERIRQIEARALDKLRKHLHYTKDEWL